MIHMLFV